MLNSRNWLFLFLSPQSPSPHFYQLFFLGIQIFEYVCAEMPTLTYLCAAQNLLYTRTGWVQPQPSAPTSSSKHRQVRSGMLPNGFIDTLAAAGPVISLSCLSLEICLLDHECVSPLGMKANPCRPYFCRIDCAQCLS